MCQLKTMATKLTLYPMNLNQGQVYQPVVLLETFLVKTIFCHIFEGISDLFKKPISGTSILAEYIKFLI